MDNEQKLELIRFIEKASVTILGLLFILYPILFTNLTTDFFVLPKQALIVFAALVLMLLFGVKSLLSEKVRIRRTPFDVSVILFILALLLSSIFSVAPADSFTNFIPVLFAGILYFGIIYNVKNEKSVLVLVGSLLTGASLLALISIFTYFKIYVFPFDFTKTPGFTPSGSLLDQALYLLFVLPVGLYFLSPFLDKVKHRETASQKQADYAKLSGFGLACVVILAGLALSAYQIVTQPGSLILLPLETGFQTAFAAISQDSGRIIQGLLFGSGYGEYLIDFTRFKQASFNANPTLWSLAFVRSSTFVLELLATTGILGLFSYFFLCYKVLKERPLFIPLVLILAVSFILPLSFYNIALIFFLLGSYAGIKGLTDDQKYFDVELELVALKKGFIAFSQEEHVRERTSSKMLSYSVFSIIAVAVLFFGFMSYDYLYANALFRSSLVAASQNNGQLTYTDQSGALSSYTGKYVDSYYRVFSQTNLALANALANSVPKGSTPSAQTQQTIYTLVQQSINAGRQATTLSPQNTVDWQNLASIYRSLIGFGQNADSFAILAAQRAVQLDPTNPQSYITLGGIYYQLGQWNNAETQFQQAINLKPDYANAYYNLGHALEQSGDLKGALTQFQTVKQLVANDPANLKKINDEIAALEQQLGQAQPGKTQNAAQNQVQPAPLRVSTPSGTLPTQNPPVKIPAPATNVTVTPTPTP